MTDTFQPAQAAAFAPPDEGSRYISPAERPWQPTDAEGFWLKPLVHEQSGQIKTALMKIDPGAFAPLHAHEELEQILVLEGSFYDQDRKVRAGDFVVRAPGARHTAGSEDGALVLLIFSRGD